MKTARFLLILILCLAPLGLAQTPAPPAAAPPAAAPPAAPAAAPVMITDQDVKALSGPDAKARANGDPDGSLTGTINDITIADPVTDKTPKAKGLTVTDIANQVGQNKIADQLRLDVGHWIPGHVHAGRLRHRRNRPMPREERQPHHDDELHGVWRRHAGLSG